jgi:hypothetical protein
VPPPGESSANHAREADAKEIRHRLERIKGAKQLSDPEQKCECQDR